MKQILPPMKALALGRKLLCWGLASIPLIFLLHVVNNYKVEVPIWDDWLFVPIIEKSYQGTLTLQDLLAPQLPHRLLCPRIIILAFVHLTNWDPSYQIAFILCLGIGIFITLLYQLKRTEEESNSPTSDWLIPIVALLSFSLSQWENWTWGWQIVILLNVFSVVFGVMLLSGTGLGWLRLFEAMIFGIIAAHSFSSGLIFWGIGLFILIFRPGGRKNTKLLQICCWTIGGFLVIYSYLYDFPQQDFYIGQWQSLCKNPGRYLIFTIKYLGGPLVIGGPPSLIQKKAAFCAGLISLPVAVALVWLLARYCFIRFRVILPWIALALYSIGSGIMASVGRLPLKDDHSLASRYVTIASLFWLFLIVLFYLFAGHCRVLFKSKGNVLLFRIIVVLMMLGIMVLVTLNSIDGGRAAALRHESLRKAPRELLSAQSLSSLKKLMSLHVRIQSMKILKKHHLSVFRDRHLEK